MSDDVDLAEKNSREQSNPAKDVTQWLIDVGHGVLSTISNNEEVENYPLASVVPFALTPKGKPYILVASIAAHTKNLLQNQKSSLFISHPNPEGDPQSFWRACLIGKFKQITSEPSTISNDKNRIVVSEVEEDLMLTRYCAQVPNAKAYLKTHNFSFWVMDEIIKIRYIAGFGRICWIDGNEYLGESIQPSMESVKDDSIEHMNDDHVDAMIDIFDGHFGKKSSKVLMQELDSRGIFLQCQDSKDSKYVPFNKTIDDDQLRHAIIDLVKISRNLINER